MLPRRTLALVLTPILAFTTAGSALGATRLSEPPKSLEVAEPNAALRYWTAWALVPPAAMEKANTLDWVPIAKELKASKMPKEFTEAAAAADDDMLEPLLDAASTLRCDFEPRYDLGVDMMLPHLGKMRASARLLRVAARDRLISGDTEAAVACTTAMVHMAHHLTSDRTIISSLVGLAIGTTAMGEMEVLAASRQLNDDDRAKLLSALTVLDNADPAGIRGALAFEKTSIGNWVRRKFTGTTAGQDFAEHCRDSMQDESSQIHAAALATFDESALAAEVERAGKAYDDALAAWDGADAQERLAEIGERIEAGDYGHLAAVMSPAATKIRSSAEKFRAELKATVAKLNAGGAGAAGASGKATGR